MAFEAQELDLTACLMRRSDVNSATKLLLLLVNYIRFGSCGTGVSRMNVCVSESDLIVNNKPSETSFTSFLLGVHFPGVSYSVV